MHFGHDVIEHGGAAGFRQPTVDAIVQQAMTGVGAQGMAVAVIDDGQVVHVAAHGIRNADAAPLETDTIMYGASRSDF